MNFSAYSIKNPLVAILLFTLLTLAGIFAFKQMKVQKFPDIDIPAVIVTITQNGAAPEQLETDIAKKLENKIAAVEGIKHMRTTLQTGAVTVHSEFRLEKDLQEALDEVRSAVSEVRGDLPAAANEPIISKVSTAGFPIGGYSVASDNLSEDELSFWVDDTLARELSEIQGVGKIGRVGGTTRQIDVLPDPAKLDGWQLPITRLADQIDAFWQDIPAGQTKLAGNAQNVRVLGAGADVAALKTLPIAAPNGTTTLEQIADVRDTVADRQSSAWLMGKSVVAFDITRARGASEVAVLKAVDEKLAHIMADNPNIHIHKIYDNAKPIDEDYGASLQMLIEGCILAVIVVFVFLRDWRATIVAAAALPLSIIPAFLAMYWFGFSLNIISLLALSLVIGVLVDDAIVEVENIMRHLQMGKTPYEAAMEAADEIGLAVVATTFTLIAVFLPTAFMNGVVGQFFKQFGWTASLAIFASLLVARLVTPMMAAYMMAPVKAHDDKAGRTMRSYLSLVNWTLKNRFITIVATVAFFVGSVMLAKFLPTAFIPPDDTDQTQVTLVLTPDSMIEKTENTALFAARKVAELDGVESVFVSVGGANSSRDSRSTAAGAVNNAVLNVTLLPRGSRASKEMIETSIRDVMHDVPSARATVGQSAGGDTGYNFSLTSTRADLLSQTVNRVLDDINAQGLNATSNEALPKPQLSIVPNKQAMADKGVTLFDIANVLRIATTGDYDKALPKMNFDTRQVPIVVHLSDAARADLPVLQGLYVKPGVRLGDVATLQLDTSASQIARLDRKRAIKITVQSEMPLGELTQVIKNTPTLKNLPDGIGIIEEGQAENMNELFSGFVLAMGVGVICIFGVLMLLFHKVLQPFTILMALPLSIGGAFIGLIIAGSSLSMPSMIGFIMLMGIATKNSILLVDYAILAQNAGKNQTAAIMDACQKRARPIIMTTIAMGAGMLPLVFGWSGADPTFRRPMATAVLGGLITSTFLSLVVIPVIYTLMNDLAALFGRRVGQRAQQQT